MSLSITCTLVNGVKFYPDSLKKKMKNPNFGKFKFDPETGAKVTEFIHNDAAYQILINQVDDFDCHSKNGCEVIYPHDGEDAYFFGKTWTVGDDYDTKTTKVVNTMVEPFRDSILDGFICDLQAMGVKYEIGTFIVYFVC